VILLYHRVTRLADDRWSIAVTPEHFAEHMELLRHRATLVPLEGLRAALDAPNANGPIVSVTFDDGYADNFHEALPILSRWDVPATFFVASGPVSRGREFWWDDLDRLVSAEQYGDTWTRLRDLSGAERDATLESLRHASGLDPSPRPGRRALSPDELACLARDARIEIGAHSVSHSRLAPLPAEAQRTEIEESRRQLSAIVGRPIESFAYPFGRAADYTLETMSLVRDAGFSRACINQPGRVDRSTDRFALPRIYVRDWSGDELAAAVRNHDIRL
jgi:peptidoglycan/xylan/chitin deacetylase (PgdA/CDA1 family)